MDLGIAGKVALVSGASKGIGRAVAQALVAEGCRVAIASRSAERIEATAAEIGAHGLVWNTSDVDGAGPLVDAVEATLGAPVEIVVCNTGGPPASDDPLTFSTEDWQEAHRSLVLAPMALVRRCVPSMRERRWGRVINVGSTAAREPIPSLILSNSHRAAALAAWKTLAGATAADGVTFNTVLPGRIETDRIAGIYGSVDAARTAALTEVPASRLGTVAEFATAVAFLCSDAAGYVTGETLRVDGGFARAV